VDKSRNVKGRAKQGAILRGPRKIRPVEWQEEMETTWSGGLRSLMVTKGWQRTK